MKKGLIYIVGVILLGLGYGVFKEALGNPIFAVSAIAYLVALCLIAEKFGR